MDQKIKDFYEAHNIPVSKMVFTGKAHKNLSEEAVKKAAVLVYEDIISGAINLPPIRYAWEVFARAKMIKVDSDASEVKDLKKANREMKSKLDYAALPWWEKAKRRLKRAYES